MVLSYLQLFLDVIQFLQNLMQQLLRIENISNRHFVDLFTFFFFFEFLESIYEPAPSKYTL